MLATFKNMYSNAIYITTHLQQAATKLATALNDSLPPPDECQHKFSDAFEEKIQLLIKGIGTKCYTVAIQDSTIRK